MNFNYIHVHYLYLCTLMYTITDYCAFKLILYIGNLHTEQSKRFQSCWTIFSDCFLHFPVRWCWCLCWRMVWMLRSKRMWDLYCVCSFRMCLLSVFECLYISYCSSVLRYCPFLCVWRIFRLWSMLVYVWPVSIRWLANADSVFLVIDCMCSLYRCVKLRPVCPI